MKKEELKEQVSEILCDALQMKEKYRLDHDNGRSYIKWGRVERDIHDLIDQYEIANNPMVD